MNITTIVMLVLLVLCGFCYLMTGPDGYLSILKIYQPTILNYRLKRLLLAVIAGSSLAASGTSMQALFRNPLADPHLFGISGGAALGASIAIGFFSHQALTPSTGAILGGLLSFLLILSFAQAHGEKDLDRCLLLGILLNSLAASIITLLKTILPANKAQSLLFWLVGHIGIVGQTDLLFIVPLWILGLAIIFSIRHELELLSFGQEESLLLGINTNRVLKLSIIANCILVGNVVAFAGMIGFLGLVVPHMLRILGYWNLKHLVPMSALAGALAMTLFDCLSRVSFFYLHTEIPSGALAALFLCPIFFYLLMKRRYHG